MTSTPPGAAAAAVLNTTELCEGILKNSCFEDLLRVRQVNHFLPDVIQGSKPLQQKLYLLHTAQEESPPVLNPLFTRFLAHQGIELDHERGGQSELYFEALYTWAERQFTSTHS